jgi:hypothetical protein
MLEMQANNNTVVRLAIGRRLWCDCADMRVYTGDVVG